jgi:hypothetical protein
MAWSDCDMLEARTTTAVRITHHSETDRIQALRSRSGKLSSNLRAAAPGSRAICHAPSGGAHAQPHQPARIVGMLPGSPVKLRLYDCIRRAPLSRRHANPRSRTASHLCCPPVWEHWVSAGVRSGIWHDGNRGTSNWPIHVLRLCSVRP